VLKKVGMRLVGEVTDPEEGKLWEWEWVDEGVS
jgi:hypothetical protein